MENSMAFLKHVKIELPYNPEFHSKELKAGSQRTIHIAIYGDG